MNKETVLVLSYNMAKAQEVAKKIRTKHVYCQVAVEDGLDKLDFSPIGIVAVADDISEINMKKTAALKVDLMYFDSSVAETCNDDDCHNHDCCGDHDSDHDFDDDEHDCCHGEHEKSQYSTQLENLNSFLFNKLKCAGDWTVDKYIDEMIKDIKDTAKDNSAICALSGGVDSTVCAALVSRAIGKKLTCVFVDTGLMRKNEGDEVEEMMKSFDINFIRVNAQDRFLSKLAGVTDPETKRKIIGAEFVRVFEEQADKFSDATCLVQGTIYPDILESGIGGHLVKSHHNVGGMPEDMRFSELIEPLKDLFKDEVREVGMALGISRDKVFRQPFPGPGLAVRCIGEVNKHKLDILRDADFIFRDEIAKAGVAEQIWQYFAIMTDIKSTGVINGKRDYGYVIALRAINSIDAMSASVSPLSYGFLDQISTRIIDEVQEVGRVVYDITNKPPGTIEWE